MALAVLHADEVNFAGVAPIMIRTAEGETLTIDGLGTWPASIPAELFMREHDGTIPLGPAAHRRAGRSRRLDHRPA